MFISFVGVVSLTTRAVSSKGIREYKVDFFSNIENITHRRQGRSGQVGFRWFSVVIVQT